MHTLKYSMPPQPLPPFAKIEKISCVCVCSGELYHGDFVIGGWACWEKIARGTADPVTPSASWYLYQPESRQFSLKDMSLNSHVWSFRPDPGQPGSDKQITFWNIETAENYWNINMAKELSDFNFIALAVWAQPFEDQSGSCCPWSTAHEREACREFNPTKFH